MPICPISNTTDLTPAVLAEMKGLEAAATPGPWDAIPDNIPCLIDAGVYANGIRIISPIAPLAKLRTQREPNALLIAALRNHAAALIQAAEERDELQASADLRWKCDMRAIKAWQAAHPGNDNVWPDHADLCVWLMEERGERRPK